MLVRGSTRDTPGSSYELAALSTVGENTPVSTPADAATFQSEPSLTSVTAMRGVGPYEGVNVQELAPVDRGIQAWTFSASGFVLETLIWGFGYR